MITPQSDIQEFRAFQALKAWLAEQVREVLREELAALALPATAEPGERLLNVDQLVERLALSESTVRDLLTRGEFGPVVKIGAAVRVRQADFDRFIRRRAGVNEPQTAAAAGSVSRDKKKGRRSA